MPSIFFLSFFLLSNMLGTMEAKHNYNVPVDNRTLDQIYHAALAEAGNDQPRVVVYAGGNRAFMARTLNNTVPAFERRFPGIQLDIVVGGSPSRVNIQLANNSLVVDLIQMESIHDLYRWKAEKELLYYKPIDWDNIYDEFKDSDGAFTSISGTAFALVVNTDRLSTNESNWPQSYGDLVNDPKFHNAIVGSYPIEFSAPDTTLYGYKLAVDKYGYDWLVALAGAQNATFMRDSSLIPAALSSGQYSVGLFRPIPGTIPNQRFVLPKEDKFVSYTVLTAIFKQSRHKEAAKLYMNWMLEKQMQTTLPWTVRTDVAPAVGYKHLWEYGEQSSYADFLDFYLDRAAAEKFRQEVYLIVGEPVGRRPLDPDNLLGISPE